VLCAYFPHQYLPQYVWLNKDRVVVAITSTADFTLATARALIAGRSTTIAIKNDNLVFNPSTMFLGNDSIYNDLTNPIHPINPGPNPIHPINPGPNPSYRSALTSSRSQLGGMISQLSNPSGLTTRLYAINATMYQLYQTAFPDIVKYSPLRAVIDTGVQLSFDSLLHSGWCYDLVCPPLPPPAALSWMQYDLWRSFGVRPVLKQQQLSCFVLGVANTKHIPFSSVTKPAEAYSPEILHKYFQHKPVSALSALLEQILQVTVINETALQGTIDVKFPTDIYHYTPQQMTAFLAAIGFSFTPVNRQMEVVLFTK